MASVHKLKENKYKISVYINKGKGESIRKYKTVNCDYATALIEAEKFAKELEANKEKLKTPKLKYDNPVTYMGIFLNEFCKTCTFDKSGSKICSNLKCKLYEFKKFFEQNKKAIISQYKINKKDKK